MTRSRWTSLFASLFAAASIAAPATAAPDLDLFVGEFEVPNPAPPGAGPPRTPATPAPVEDYQQTLVFQNGRQLRGELIEVTKDEVVWQRKDAGAPLRFPRVEVRQVLLVPPERLAAGASQATMSPAKAAPLLLGTVKLAGSDWLRGAVRSADGQNFTLTLADGTPLAVPRTQMEWLAFGAKPAPAGGLGVGAMALEGWLAGSPPKVEFKDGTFKVRDATWIGRTLASPTRFEVAMELPAEGEDGLQLWLQPYGPQPNSYSFGTIHLRFGRKQIQWLVYHDNIKPNDVALPAEAQAETGPVRYRIFYDGPGQRLIVLRNERQLGDWSLKPKVEPAAGQRQNRTPSAFCFSNDNRFTNDGRSQSLFQFRRLNVRPWDGILPTAGAPAPEEDRLSTGAAETQVGRLQEVREKDLVFAGQPVLFTAETMVQFPQVPAPMPDADTMLSFGDQGEVSLADLRISEGRVRGRSVFAPALELPAAALQFVAFAPQANVAPVTGDSLVFKNGDELPGALVNAVSDGKLRWRLATGQEVDFTTGRLAGVSLTGGARSELSGTVELRNGERLRGSVTAYDDRHIQWRHAILGELSVDRAQIWRLYPNARQTPMDGSQDPAKLLRDTPNAKRIISYSRVRQRSESWLAFDGRFILRSKDGGSGVQALGPVFDLGNTLDRFEVRVESISPGDNIGTLNINVLAANDGGVMISLSPYELSLYIQNPKVPNGAVNRELLVRDKLGDNVRQLRLQAFVNGPAGTIDFYVNGHYLGRCGQTASERLPGLGKSVSVDAYVFNRVNMILSEAAILPWSGELPRPGESPARSVLANGDAAACAPTALTDGSWRLESEIGPLQIPVDKVQSVEFGGQMQPASAAARVRLVDGSALLLDRFVWADGGLSAHHATFGDLRIPAAAVSELIYHPVPVRPPTVAEPGKIARKDNAAQPPP